jgi:uncharacterized protein (DUF1697 family)
MASMATSTKPLGSYVALLRGINVGGKNIIKMDALRAAFESLGLASVQTLLASGNVVFCAAKKSSRAFELAIEQLLAARFRYDAKVVVRSLGEYDRMMSAVPARWGSDPSQRYYVIFLRHEIDRPSLAAELEANPRMEEVRYVPGALLWSARITDLGQSRMRKILGKTIYQDMTVRNWSTTRKTHVAMQGCRATR